MHMNMDDILALPTCPVLYAAHDYPELNQLINRRFKKDGDVEKALKIVIGSRGLEQTKELAKEHCYAAASLAEKLPSKDSSRDCLIDYTLAQLSRDK
uniref:Uncharacterized protein n=1 Tax=Panagrolaimus davidi TaxID=227884 RepID=A0A914Q7J6_9BILA